MRHGKLLLYLLTGLLGLILVEAGWNFEAFLSTGDHGRDLYAFWRTSLGEWPFRDYFWQYGPLMPRYYAVFMLAFGPTVQSVLIGKAALVFASGLLIYLGLAAVVPAAAAALAALYFWAFRPDFFYTFNHIGGIFFLCAAACCALRHVSTGQRAYYGLALAAGVALGLVRLNLGAATLIALGAAFALRPAVRATAARQAIARDIGLALLITFGLTAVSFIGVPLAHIKKCLPYLSSYRYDDAPLLEILASLGRIVLRNFTASWPRRIFSVVLLLSAAVLVRDWKKGSGHAKGAWSLLVLGLLLVFNGHESFVNISVFRIFWVIPLAVMLFFAVIGLAAERLPRPAATAVYAVLAVIALLGGAARVQQARFYHQPVNHFLVGENDLYIANGDWGAHADSPQASVPELEAWKQTVADTTAFIREHTASDEAIFALPYDGLYYFLAQRPAAVWDQAFFPYLHITPREEIDLIRALDERRVRFVVVSNRAYSTEPHLGVFGRDYAPGLARYLFENYDIVAAFGDWTNPPGFVDHHGTRILRRRFPAMSVP